MYQNLAEGVADEPALVSSWGEDEVGDDHHHLHDDNYDDDDDNYNNLGGSWRDRQFVGVHIENPANVEDLLKKKNTLSTNHVVIIEIINTINYPHNQY